MPVINVRPLLRHYITASCLVGTQLLIVSCAPPLIFSARPKERQPLLGSEANGGHHRTGSFARITSIFNTQGQPSYVDSFKWILFDSWWNILLVFIPLSIISHRLDWDAAFRFSFSFIAIMPLAKVRLLTSLVLAKRLLTPVGCAVFSCPTCSSLVKPLTNSLLSLERLWARF